MDKEIVELYLDDIIPNRFQPREVFNEEALKELSASIKEHGVIQPIIVRKIGDKYEIIAGERRYKASTMAGLIKIPAIIRNLDDKEASKVALLENLQRKDLTAIEEARTYQKILELDSMTQEELGRTMGKSQAAIANKMRLLSLPDEVQEALLQDKISERHARSLLNLDKSEDQINMLQAVINNRMTVRELDEKIKEIKGDSSQTSINININKELKEENNNQPIEEEVFDFEIPAPTPDPIESLDEDLRERAMKIVSIDLPKQESEFKKIDDLLNDTKVYKIEDAISDIKSMKDKIEKKGFITHIEEKDYENNYQIIITVDKNS